MLPLLIVILIALVVGIIVKMYSFSDRFQRIEYDLLKFRQLGDQLEVLEREIKALKSSGISGVTQKDQATAPPAAQAEASPLSVIPPPVESVQFEAPPLPVQQAVRFVAEVPKPSRTREEWEAFVGGKLLNRIGALALIIGVGLFLKHAFDQNWISETVRVLIGAVTGFLCLAGAYRTNQKGLRIFAQGLVGAGIAILYLSVYASFNFYALVPQTVAFVLMAFVTTIALALAFYYDSLATALLGLIGGFLTPIMLSTGESNEIGLFTYLALLNVGLLGSLLRKEKWVVIEPISLFSTWLLYFSWHTRYYRPDDLVITMLFVTVFWGLYYALDVFRMMRAQTNLLPIHHVDAVVSGTIFFSTLVLLVDSQYHEWMGATTIIVGAIYFATILLVRMRSLVPELAKARYLLSALVLFAGAASIQFDDFTLAIVWSLQAALLLWCGLRFRLRYIWGTAIALFALAIMRFLLTNGGLSFEPIHEFKLLVSLRTGTLAVITIALAFGGWLVSRYSARATDEPLDWARDALFFSWCATLFLLLTVETNDYFRWLALDKPSSVQDAVSYQLFLTLPVVWILHSAFLAWMSVRMNAASVIIASLGALALSVLLSSVRGIAYEPIVNFALLLNVRAIGMVVVLAGVVAVAGALRGQTERWQWLRDVLGVLQITVVIVLLLLITAETRDYFEKQIADLWASSGDRDISEGVGQIHNLQQLWLSGVWLLYSVSLMALGVWRAVRNIRVVAFVLFGITILKVFIYDLSFLETTYRIISFIALGVILLGVSYVYQKYKTLIFGAGAQE